MGHDVAIVGMACQYPDARTPKELWENALAGRRAFRRIPAERLSLDDYLSGDRNAPDRIYSAEACVIEGYEFDRERFRVGMNAYRSSDLAHWLALDTAARALEDSGFRGREPAFTLPKQATGVYVGNTLTGEFARANTLRLRWPYVRRVLAEALSVKEISDTDRRELIDECERLFKQPFPPVNDETLAGNLSNTIAGRICNHFDLNGGGYVVDGACASSLIAVATACSALAAGDVQVALAGGVDLSLDPFELVGFAKTGALAANGMRVFDSRSSGFLPGEGCGFVVLMPLEEALKQARCVYAAIRGWGISSDGSGGITRPEVDGQVLALERAYQRAGYGITSVAYFEGHGTGTAVGDETELRALRRARGDRENVPGSANQNGELRSPAVISSVKAIIGHTKAAAGVAGLIKAVMALGSQIIPPTVGCTSPHPLVSETTGSVTVTKKGSQWPGCQQLRAAVSAMGFGGINCHIALESPSSDRREVLSPEEAVLLRSAQDAELFLIASPDRPGLRQQITHLLSYSSRLSRSELSDLAAALQRQISEITNDKPRLWKAGVVADSPAALTSALDTLSDWLTAGITQKTDLKKGAFLGAGTPLRFAFLFPGQASPVYTDGGALGRRFAQVEDFYSVVALPADGNKAATEVAQPAIVTGSLAGLRLMRELGIEASVGVGHSLGEVVALHWGGSFDEATVCGIAHARAAAIAHPRIPLGAMAAIRADEARVRALLNGDPISVACLNGPRNTVVSGTPAAISTLALRASKAGIASVTLPVSRPFHSPLIAPAADLLRESLMQVRLPGVTRNVISTVSGSAISPGEDLLELLCRQITAPVRFVEAAALAGEMADFFVEVGPGQILTGLMNDLGVDSAASLDVGGESIKGVLQIAAAAFASGASIRTSALFEDRFTRSFDLDWRPRFFQNPCELAPIPSDHVLGTLEVLSIDSASSVGSEAAAAGETNSPATLSEQDSSDVLTMIRRLVADRAELSIDSISPGDRMLADLHFNSITVSQMIVEASRRLGVPPPIAPTDYANVTVLDMSTALEETRRNKTSAAAPEKYPAGVAPWVRCFTVELLEERLDAESEKECLGAELQEKLGTELEEERPDTELKRGVGSGPRDSISPGSWKVYAPPGHPLGNLAGLFSETSRVSGSVLARNEHGRFSESARFETQGASPRNLRGSLCLRGEEVSNPASLPVPAERSTLPGNGVLVALSPGSDLELETLLCAAKDALDIKTPSTFVLVQHGTTAAGLARSLHLERPDINVCVLDIPWKHPSTVQWIIGEVNSCSGYSEAHYDARGIRRTPILRPISLAEPLESLAPLPFGPDDVILVTGGGKGIGAECALAVAQRAGARLALLGRSERHRDPDLDTNLARLERLEVKFRYIAADVTDSSAMDWAVKDITSTLGPVTCIVHGAGANVPALLESFTPDDFQATVAPKVAGLRNVLSAIDPGQLKTLVAFGSLIARSGMKGESHYALANERLRELVEEWQSSHPGCRCRVLEWSVWSGAGMGERLGTIDRLAEQGISAISLDDGIEMFCRVLSAPDLPVSVVVSSRFGSVPTLRCAPAPLPFRRFLEQPRVFYPGIELIADCELSAQSDPYLDDHVFDGNRLFPAVMGLEAMAQVATALLNTDATPCFENVSFNLPIAVPDNGPTVIRIAALVSGPDKVELAIRSAETGFQRDHFRALCRFDASANPAYQDQESTPVSTEFGGTVDLDPGRELYGNLLFHRGRFERIRRYRKVTSTEAVAEISSEKQSNWFSRFLPGELLLGDPGRRDAAIHSIQVCVPDGTMLPIGVDRILIASGPAATRSGSAVASNAGCIACAAEISRTGDVFTYDLTVTDIDGRPIEFWKGLRLRRVTASKAAGSWTAPLLGPYIERTVRDRFEMPWISIAVARNTAPAVHSDGNQNGRNGKAASHSNGFAATSGTDRVIQRAVGQNIEILRRPDGKPQAVNGHAVSASHSGALTFAVAESHMHHGISAQPRNEARREVTRLSCDVEAVTARLRTVWKDLLGESMFTVAEAIALESGNGTNVQLRNGPDTPLSNIDSTVTVIRRDSPALPGLTNAGGISGDSVLAAAALASSFDVAATRIWCANECLRKSGLPIDSPLIIDGVTGDGWVFLRSGHCSIATYVAIIAGSDEATVFAILAR